ncbi:uncharacterized protein [Aegilops tauschii subsp. strangulata]|uniref:uncharacterized protein n=1 Tax=Aegilops tauschii subsp. strangulata TaxID=200361 RepID=UPI000989B77A|nr:uncharacterized protein LOC109737504 [Aegilops tauschii subsp. strangulata]
MCYALQMPTSSCGGTRRSLSGCSRAPPPSGCYLRCWSTTSSRFVSTTILVLMPKLASRFARFLKYLPADPPNATELFLCSQPAPGAGERGDTAKRGGVGAGQRRLAHGTTARLSGANAVTIISRMFRPARRRRRSTPRRRRSKPRRKITSRRRSKIWLMPGRSRKLLYWCCSRGMGLLAKLAGGIFRIRLMP